MITEIQAPIYSQEWVDFYASAGTPLVGGKNRRNILFEAEGRQYVLHTLENEIEFYLMLEGAARGVSPDIVAVNSDQQWALMEYQRPNHHARNRSGALRRDRRCIEKSA